MKVKFTTTKQKHSISVFKKPKTNDYKVFNEKGTLVGDFSVEKHTDMYISRLFVKPEERGHGYGTKMLDFIQKMSVAEGLGGKMRVLASLMGNETKNPPHIFYRKYGFTSDRKDLLEEIDNHIKKKEQLPPYFRQELMYFIPKKHS